MEWRRFRWVVYFLLRGGARDLKKQKSPCLAEAEQGLKRGGGSAPRSLSQVPSLGTCIAGRWLPDATLRDSRSCRPHDGAVQGLAILKFRVRLICPSARGCSPGLPDPAKRHLQVICLSTPWHKVGHRFWRCVGPCNGSRLLPLRLRSSCLAALRFVASPPGRMVFTALVLSPWPSRLEPRLCPTFRRISSGWPLPANFWFMPC